MPPALRIRPYKDFLSPLNLRRFNYAAATVGILCYLEAIYLGGWKGLFWTWFPYGWLALRTGLLFVSAFLVFVLRVSTLHVGIRTSISGWDTFTKYATRFNVVETFGEYMLSAWLFSEIYVWSASKDADLGRVKLIPRTDRLMLNERPIYLTAFIFFLAVFQSGWHLFHDYDRIDMPVTKTKPLGSPNQLSHIPVPPLVQLKSNLLAMMVSCLKRSICVSLAAPFIYSLNWLYPWSIRKLSWNWTRLWAKMFYNLPKSGSLPSIAPYHWTVILQSIVSGFLLLMLWEVANAAFSAYVAQEPLKNERPLTYESRDPNGTLLTGLRGRQLQTRAFAMWELLCLAQGWEQRRRSIYDEIDRAGGSTWSQILAICLEVVSGMEARITSFQTPNLPISNATTKSLGVRDPALPPSPELLPRIAQPLGDGINTPGDIILPASETAAGKARRAAVAMGRFVKSHGESPPESFSSRSKALLSKAEETVLDQQQQQSLSQQGVTGLFRKQFIQILETPLGWPFRQGYRRRVTAVVLGAPYGDVGIIVDAIDSLTRFAIRSLTEDKYGNVQKDIKAIMLTFTTAIIKLESFRAQIDIHWTDVQHKRECPEVDTILAALRGGLSALLDSFEQYATALKISRTDLRRVKEAAAAPRLPEMSEGNGRAAV